MLLLKVSQNSLESVCVRAYPKVEPKTRYVQWDLRPEIRDAYDTWEPKRGDGNQGYYDKRDPIP